MHQPLHDSTTPFFTLVKADPAGRSLRSLSLRVDCYRINEFQQNLIVMVDLRVFPPSGVPKGFLFWSTHGSRRCTMKRDDDRLFRSGVVKSLVAKAKCTFIHVKQFERGRSSVARGGDPCTPSSSCRRFDDDVSTCGRILLIGREIFQDKCGGKLTSNLGLIKCSNVGDEISASWHKASTTCRSNFDWIWRKTGRRKSRPMVADYESRKLSRWQVSSSTPLNESHCLRTYNAPQRLATV